MKPPWEWDEDDLLALVASGTKESIELDYKECAALAQTDGKKNEVSKDVSALANSAGGTIVYGMVENGHVPIRLDSGYDPSVISKEWLDQVINSRIQRRIDGVRINQVELTKTSPGKVAYVVHVPQSTRAPHQAADKRFYKRFNFESVPMEEYEVRDVSRRFEAPDLRLLFEVSEEPTAQQAPEVTPPVQARVQIMPVITNDAVTPAEYIVISVFVDTRLAILRGTEEFRHVVADELTYNGQKLPCMRLAMNWAVPGKIPVFHGVTFQLVKSPLSVRVPGPGLYLLGWQLDSPRMAPKRSTVPLTWGGTAVPSLAESGAA
jgi:hypothetical protein